MKMHSIIIANLRIGGDVLSHIEEILEYNKKFVENNQHELYTSTLRINMWAAEIVLKYPKIKLEAVLSYENQSTYCQEEKMERYFNILAKCDFVNYISKRYTPIVEQAQALK